MDTLTALKILTEEMHSAAIATTDSDGRPQIRIIDIMLYDGGGVYFLTAKGKAFYKQLTEQKYIALSAVKDKKSISLRGYVKNIGTEKLDEIFVKNSYMQALYPQGTRGALQVFVLYKGEGQYFDISDPQNVYKSNFTIGDITQKARGYSITNACKGCKLCYGVCPQKCIDFTAVPPKINVNNCLNCGNCLSVCPQKAIKAEV